VDVIVTGWPIEAWARRQKVGRLRHREFGGLLLSEDPSGPRQLALGRGRCELKAEPSHDLQGPLDAVQIGRDQVGLAAINVLEILKDRVENVPNVGLDLGRRGQQRLY